MRFIDGKDHFDILKLYDLHLRLYNVRSSLIADLQRHELFCYVPEANIDGLMLNPGVARSGYLRSLFYTFHIRMTLCCCLMENVTQPVRYFIFCHVVWNGDLVKPRKFSLSQICSEHQPAVALTFDSDVSPKNIEDQHHSPRSK